MKNDLNRFEIIFPEGILEKNVKFLPLEKELNVKFTDFNMDSSFETLKQWQNLADPFKGELEKEILCCKVIDKKGKVITYEDLKTVDIISKDVTLFSRIKDRFLLLIGKKKKVNIEWFYKEK